jgi:hypothetical protein
LICICEGGKVVVVLDELVDVVEVVLEVEEVVVEVLDVVEAVVEVVEVVLVVDEVVDAVVVVVVPPDNVHSSTPDISKEQSSSVLELDASTWNL